MRKKRADPQRRRRDWTRPVVPAPVLLLRRLQPPQDLANSPIVRDHARLDFAIFGRGGYVNQGDTTGRGEDISIGEFGKTLF